VYLSKSFVEKDESCKSYTINPIALTRAKFLHFASMVRRMTICPNCRCDNVTRSHRRPIEKLFLGLLKISPYRCQSCDTRFYLRASGTGLPQSSATGPSVLSRT
jgi:hypothetical protein